jgi:hypothetical protein
MPARAGPVPAGAPPAGLSLDDILDLRAYERVRDDYRQRVIARKRRRRVPLGPVATVVFECVDTVRFQVQEMARAERIATDEGIQQELDVYNRLLPRPGELSATLFLELTSEPDLRYWLPRLVGIERSLAIEVGTSGAGPLAVVASEPEASHAEALTRESVTPAVHYLRFPFGKEARRRFGDEPVALAAHHPEYEARTVLDAAVRAELLGDLEGRTEPLPFG